MLCLVIRVMLISLDLVRTAWLPRIIAWALQFGDDAGSNTTALPRVTEELYDEVDEVWTRMDVIYSLVKTSMRPANQVRIFT